MGKACSAGSLVVVLAAGLCELRARSITLPAADDSHSILNAPRRINLPLDAPVFASIGRRNNRRRWCVTSASCHAA